MMLTISMVILRRAVVIAIVNEVSSTVMKWVVAIFGKRNMIAFIIEYWIYLVEFSAFDFYLLLVLIVS